MWPFDSKDQEWTSTLKPWSISVSSGSLLGDVHWTRFSPAGSGRRPDEDPSSSSRWSRWSGKEGSRPRRPRAPDSASPRGRWPSSPCPAHLRCTYTWDRNNNTAGERGNQEKDVWMCGGYYANDMKQSEERTNQPHSSCGSVCMFELLVPIWPLWYLYHKILVHTCFNFFHLTKPAERLSASALKKTKYSLKLEKFPVLD